MKPIKLSIYILLSVVLLFTLTCDIYDKSVPEYLDKYTNTATVADHSFTGGMLINQQGVPYQNLIEKDSSVITLKLRNPKNYEIVTNLEYHNGSDWIPFIRDEAPGDYSTVENTSAYFTGTTITVKYEPTTQIRITITDAEIGQSYKLRVRLYDRETKREFEPYVLPSIKCTGYPKAVGFMMVRAGTGNNGVVVDWQQLLRSGTTTGDLADANRLVISCSDLGVSQTYTRALNEVTSIWGPWSPAGINEASNPFFSITLGAGTLDEGRSYNVVLRFSNEAGVVTEISESLTAATMDARIVRGGGLQTDEYPSLQEAFNSMDTHGETSATITVLRSIMDQAPVTISGNKTINLESSGTNMIQLGAAHAGSALLTVHNGLTLKIGGALTLRGIDPNTTALISINSGGTLTLDAGAIITGNKTNSATGGGVYIGGGTLNMLAGSSINGNAASTGGGVYIGGVGSIFTMSGGEITGNTSTSNGGGVYFASGTFNMSNGSIEGNTATTSGGGVNVNGAGSTFTMSGGNINGNTALDGGGVRLGVGNFNMSSGTITGNGGSNGGGVSVAGGTFAFSGGTIGGTTTQTRNTATTSGGGVYISGGTFNFSNGTITGNTASQYGGGVYLGGTSSVTMSGGSVESNSATINGGGVHLAAGTFTMSGGVVYGSDATPSSLANTSNGNGKSLNVAGGSAVYAAPYGTGNILSGGTGSYAYTLPMYEAVVTINGTDTPFETLADAFGSVTSGPAPAALITLRKNVTNFRTDVTGNKTITLVSEGDKQIELGTASGSMFVVYSGSTLILGGTTPGELTLVGKATSTAALVTVDNGGTLTVNEDTIISGNTNSGGSGGGVNSSGTFILSGGNITGNTAGDGGGVFIGAGIFIMTSGTIENNNSTYNGGGVYVTNMGEEFNMSNGVIRGNKGTGASSVGGGVYFAGQSFRMSNGQIGGTSSSNQNSARNGGGVYIAGGNQAIFTFSGGTIGGEGSNCNQAIGSTGMGGGVYIAGGTFDIPTGSSAIIKGNTADSSATGGGGVYVGANATFNMRSGQIGGTSGTSANSATLGGGVYVAGTGVTNAGTFNLYGGTIGGNGSASNTTGAGGGGVAIGAFGFFNIPTGSATAEIKGNTSAGTGGGGVLVLDSGVFTMRAGTIKENNSTATGGVNGGGGVQVYYGTFTMEGGRIEANNAARSGGGVFVYGNSAIFAISGGYVYGNDGAGYSPTGVPNVRGASGSGASICIESSGTARYEGAYGGDVIYTTDATLPETPMVRLTIAGVHTEYIRLAAAFAAIPDGSTATVTLLDNITSQMPIPAITGTDRTITLTNEGGPRTINLTSSGSLLTADAGTKLIIEGSSPVNTITLKGMAGNNNSLIRVLNGGELVLNTNAILSGNTQNSAGGGVYVSGATSKFTMNSGIIENNQGSSGGGVYLISGTFEMNGGIIQGNLVGSTGYGGGVYITTGGNFIMNNGTITNNSVNLSTNRGGGVYLDNGIFKMSGNARVTPSASNNDIYLGSTLTIDVSEGFLGTDKVGRITPSSPYGVRAVLSGATGNDNTRFDVTPDAGTQWLIDSSGYLQMAVAMLGTTGSETYYTTLAEAITAAAATGEQLVTMLNNTSSPAINIGTKTIRLTVSNSPRTINLTGQGSLFTVGIGGTLVLVGQNATNTLTLNGVPINNAALVTVNGGTLMMSANAKITGNNNTSVSVIGGGVLVNSGTMTMDGGTIAGNTALSGGGIRVTAGTLTMSGGVIGGGTTADANTATASGSSAGGGGVCISGSASFYMSNGTIRGNKSTGTASNMELGGGGVLFYSTGTFDISGGANIEGNTSNYYGGGVLKAGTGTMNMSGGVIYDNAVTYTNGHGGGVFVSAGTFTVSSGTINGNDAWDGGGVYVEGGTFRTTTNNAVISYNTAGSGGAGVFISASALFDMQGGTIENNKARVGRSISGAGVLVSTDGSFTMSNGFIQGNDAWHGGGVFVGGTFTMSGSAVIRSNNASGTGTAGGAVRLSWGAAKMIMNGGTIGGSGTERNIAIDGGGVSVDSGCEFTMTGGIISGNIATSNGGGVSIGGSTGKFTMSGGTIYGDNEGVINIRNTAPNGASFHAVAGATAQYAGGYGNSAIVTTNETIPEIITLDFGGPFTSTGLQSSINSAPTKTKIVLPAGGDFGMDDSVTIAGKEIFITTAPGASVALTRPGVNFPAFTVGSGGKLVLTGSTGGVLTIKGDNDTASSGYALILVNNGGELVINDGVKISDTQSNSRTGIEVTGVGSKMTMTGGELSGHRRNGAVEILSGASFLMSGGKITQNVDSQGGHEGGGVWVTGTGSTFTMEGDAEISNNNSSSSVGGVGIGTGATFNMNGGSIFGNYASTGYGGGVYVFSGASFFMTNGTIRSNYITSNALFGGGVYIADGGMFNKIGGTIYGGNAGSPNWNRITNNPTPADLYYGQGYAVYCADGHKVRDDTSNISDNMSSSLTGTAGGWKPILTAGSATIGGTAVEGETLTATAVGLDGSGTIKYIWRRGITNIPSSNSSTYVIQAADVGQNITVAVYRADNSGSIVSAAVVPTAAP